jgi:hypothetical protein
MRFAHTGFEHLPGQFFGWGKMGEAIFGRMNNLLGSQRPAGMAAHAIGNHHQRDTSGTRMLKNRHTILLLLAITEVLCNASINC